MYDGDQEQNDETVPDYLQTTNSSLDIVMANQRLPLDALRQMALLKHKIAEGTMEKERWNVYLKLGLGQWETQESRRVTVSTIDRQYWPVKVKLAAVATSNRSSNDTHEHDIDQRLETLTTTLEHHRMVYRERQQSLIDFTDDTEQAIDAFVQHYGVPLLRAQQNYRIPLVEYEYDVELLEREFLRMQPTEYQVSER